MRTVIVMYDTLSRSFLPPYGCDWTHAPNFSRLAERTAVFDTCYAGSMPCMPARREMHTGRYNFLHRSWGQLETFDDSAPEILDRHGVHTHLVTDHKHYWDDMSATYHPRFTTFDFVRGQQGDRWLGDVEALRAGISPDADPGAAYRRRGALQHAINIESMPSEDLHSQTIVFDRGLDFIERNREADDWLLQIETFDPHEPFFTYDHYRDLYPRDGEAAEVALYNPVAADQVAVNDVRRQYAALLSHCDRSLGRVLDKFDQYDLWQDTALIVCTDHGFLLGEHGWWGKSVQPWYDEAIHTPLFAWDPRERVAGERRKALVQTIDIAPTVLDLHGIAPTTRMQGKSLAPVIATDETIHDYALFGSYGAHVNVTDGRYVYMRACVRPDNSPLAEYTLSPWRVGPRHHRDIASAELVGPLDFTLDSRVLRMPVSDANPFIYALNPAIYGTLLFDLETDPGQLDPLVDTDLELAMVDMLVTAMRASAAPSEQYERLGLPEEGAVTEDHLLAESQHDIARSTILSSQGSDKRRGLHTPVATLLSDDLSADIARQHLVAPRDNDPLSPMQHAVLGDGVLPISAIHPLAADLAAAQ